MLSGIKRFKGSAEVSYAYTLCNPLSSLTSARCVGKPLGVRLIKGFGASLLHLQ